MQTSSSKAEDDYKPDLEPVKTICRCCLTTERRVLSISLFITQYLDLAGLNVSESDGLPPWLCYECCGLLQKSIRFKHKLLKANAMLWDYLMRCAPFPIDAQDPELSKYSTPNLRATDTLVFDNMGRCKLGYQKILEHEKQPVESALDAVELPPLALGKIESESGSVKEENEAFSDYEDNITLDEFRSSAPKISDTNISTMLVDDENLVKVELEDKDLKKKRKTKKKEEKEKIRKKRKSKEPTNGTEEPKTSIRKTIELDPTKIRIVMLNPEEQFKQSEEESKAKFPFQCHLCYKGFNFDTKLENHMRKHSPSRGPFSCSLCSMYFPTAYSHSVHAHIHTRRYECCACGRRMTDRASILDHYRTQHEGLVSHFTCHLCGKVSNNSKTHRGHMRNHHSGQRPECEQCGKTFVNKDSLEEHRQIHQGIKNYSCSECGKRFRTRTQIKHHQLKHTDVKEYYCVECDVRFKSAHSLRQHLLKSLKHKDKQSLKYGCTRCEKRFDNARALTHHTLVQHEGLRPHACPDCPAALASRTGLAKHRHHVHGGARPPPRHVCDACGKGFRVSLTHHTLVQHEGLRPHACPDCPAALASRTGLAKHRHHVHGGARPPPRHVCDACGKGFRVSLTHHTLVQHEGLRPHACPDCPAALASRTGLAKHRHHVHGGARPPPRHVCDACGKGFRVSLTHHTLVQHEGLRPHACPDCPAALASRTGLAKHRHHVHGGARPPPRHVCDACGKGFRVSLTHHTLVQHEGLRPHACPDCPAALASRTGLAKHRHHVHGGARPPPRHVCDACGKGFRGKSVLVNHVRTHTGEKPFSCVTCGRKFSQRTAMRTHVDLVHLKRRRGKAKQEPATVAPAEPAKSDLFTKEEPQIVFDAWNRQTNLPNCEIYFTVTAGP